LGAADAASQIIDDNVAARAKTRQLQLSVDLSSFAQEELNREDAKLKLEYRYDLNGSDRDEAGRERGGGHALLLTFSTPVPRIQFEYYDASILTKQGAERQLNFEVVSSYPTEKALFQVQEPFQAEKFTLTPPASSTFTGADGLTYAVLDIPALARDETFSLTANYSRATDVLSAQNLAGPPAEHAADLPPAAESPVAQPLANENLTLGYGLIGIGVTLLLGVVVYWLWSKKATPAKVRLASRRPKRIAKPVEASAPVTSPAAGPTRNFCYRCGVTLREDANFCHSCGAERRRE